MRDSALVFAGGDPPPADRLARPRPVGTRDRGRLRPRPRARARLHRRRRGRRPRLGRPPDGARGAATPAPTSSRTRPRRTRPTSSSRSVARRDARRAAASPWSAGVAAATTTSSPTRWCSATTTTPTSTLDALVGTARLTVIRTPRRATRRTGLVPLAPPPRRPRRRDPHRGPALPAARRRPRARHPPAASRNEFLAPIAVGLARRRRAPRRPTRSPLPHSVSHLGGLMLRRLLLVTSPSRALALATTPSARHARSRRHRQVRRRPFASSPTTRSRSRRTCSTRSPSRPASRSRCCRAATRGTVVNQAILTKDNPIGDVLFGVDNTFLTARSTRASSSATSRPPLDDVSPRRSDSTPSRASRPIDYGDVCINYDKEWFAEPRREGPEDAAATSRSPRTRTSSWWRTRRPRRRGSRSCSPPSPSSARTDGSSTGSSCAPTACRSSTAGSRRSTTSSAAVAAAGAGRWSCRTRRARRRPCTSPTRPPTSRPIGTMTGACFRQVEFAGVLKGTEHRAAARKLVDFLLSEQFQADMPLQMFVFPARDGTPLPKVFEQFADVAGDPYTLPVTKIGAGPRRVDQTSGPASCCGDAHRASAAHRVRAAVPRRVRRGVLRLPGGRDPRARPRARRHARPRAAARRLHRRRRCAAWCGSRCGRPRSPPCSRWRSALPGAYVLARLRFPGRTLVRALVTIPFVMPTVLVASAFLALGVERSLGAILLAHVFFNYAVVVRVVGELWRHLDPHEEDAARLLGASRWRALREVTLPGAAARDRRRGRPSPSSSASPRSA